MQLIKYVTVSVLLTVLLTACNTSGGKSSNRIAIARANGSYLYLDNVRDIVPSGASSKDSLDLINRHIDNWLHETLEIQKAEENLTDEQKDVESKLLAYRNSLITYTYEKELVKQRLDTIITNEEVENYYNSNKGNFELKDNIIKVIYVKVNKDAPGVKDLKKWYKSGKMKERELLADYCHQFAENFYLNDDSWLLFDDLLKEVPIQTYNKKSFLKHNRLVEVSDSLYLYFLNIKGFKIQNSLSPLSFEEKNIKNIILNKRKLHLINQMKEDIYNDAANNNKIEIYHNDK